MADTEEDVALDAHAADLSEEQREMGLKLARLVIDGKLEEARTVARRLVDIEAEIEIAHAGSSRPATGTTSEGGRRGPGRRFPRA
jgi:ribosomal protein S11